MWLTQKIRHPWPLLRELVLKAVEKVAASMPHFPLYSWFLIPSPPQVLSSYRQGAVINGSGAAAAAADAAALEASHKDIIAQLAGRAGSVLEEFARSVFSVEMREAPL